MLCLAPVAGAASFVPLYSFCQTIDAKFHCDDGAVASSRLLQVGGDFYGTTSSGGPANFGTVFQITSAGVFKQLYSFCTQAECPDGATPGKYLAHGPDGDIYGVATRDGGPQTAGNIFKLSTVGKFATVHTFCSEKNCADGSGPVGVIFDKAGNLYGTTTAGGQYRYGTLFKISASGSFVKLHDFCAEDGCTDGFQPGALLLGRDGDLYGTTGNGGAHQAGTVYRITRSGKYTQLYSFCAVAKCTDGAQPTQTLVEGKDGNFYGITQLGGAHVQGTVFQITPAGKLTTLYSFCAQPYCDDGSDPADGLALAADGSFFGVSSGGGDYYNGVLFNITAGGKYTVVHHFCSLHGCFDGAAPTAAPTLGQDKNLYGATTAGGAKFNVGEIYKIAP
jgi:uncharacterized repeat protein (TIGR03803 family)